MKIALCIYGQPRSLVRGLELLKRFVIEPNGIQDIFIHQWFSPEMIGTRFVSSQGGNNLRWGAYRADTVELLSGLNPKKMVLEPQIDYPQNRNLRMFGDTDASRITSCFDSMKRAVALAGTDYDCIIRARIDLDWFTPLVITECEPNTVYVSHKFQFDIDPIRISIKGIPYIRTTDLFMYGTPATMNKMGELVDNLPMLSEDAQWAGGEEFSGLWGNGINHFTIKTFPDSFRQLRQTE